jgi:hypothetical protein
VLSATKLLSVLNCVACSEPVFAAELWCQQRISFRCRIVVLAANQFSLPNYGGCSESVLMLIGVACS